jgi:D-tyrosyl-tRNA(Tyr) deacylase
LRLILQRIASASVAVGGETIAEIGSGLLVLAGIEAGDDEAVVDAAAVRTTGLRMFADADGKTNLTCAEVGGEVLVVSQFTLLADVSRGRRPSFTRAAPPGVAAPLVERFVERIRAGGLPVRTGRFGAGMRIRAELDGPFTLVVESTADGS